SDLSADFLADCHGVGIALFFDLDSDPVPPVEPVDGGGFSDYIIHHSHIPYADWASSAWNDDSLLFNLVNRVKSSGKPDRHLACTGLDFSRREFTVALVDCPGHLLQGKTIILQLVLLHINLYLSWPAAQQINFRHTADLLESRQHLLFYQLIKRPGFKVRYRCQLYDRQKVTGRNF